MFGNFFKKRESAGASAADVAPEGAEDESTNTEDVATEVQISDALSLNRDLTSYDQAALDKLGISSDAMEKYKGLLSGEGVTEESAYQELCSFGGDIAKNLSATPGETEIETAASLLFGPSTSEDLLKKFKEDLTKEIGSAE